MTSFDLVVIVVALVSVAFGIWRGLVREVMALVSWIGAIWIAKLFAGVAANTLPASVTNPDIRVATGFVLVMFASLLLFTLISLLLVHLVRVAGLTRSDRAMGAAFGLLRGFLIVVVLVLLGGMTSAPREPFWRNALLSRPLVAVAQWVKPWLPDDMARRVKFE
jgi:membrane protein required for colicin V production